MSKASKQRRSDDEFKLPSAKKTKHKPEEHQSVQRIRLLDLIKGNYLGAGDEVFVKEQEGIITERGTIKVLAGSGYIEYTNPTSWTKQVTGRENGGWGQIRLKSSKQTLSSIKEQYQKSSSGLDYIEDTDTKSIMYHQTTDQLNSSTSSQPSETPSDLTLPLKVRFIGDEDRIFKIIWVSPDFKEFHTEYQGNLYTNLADFVNKIFEDFQKPSTDSTAPPPGNLRFDELMYELSPGKWVRLAGNLFPSDLMAQSNQSNPDANYQSQLVSQQPHILQQSLQHHLAYPNNGINNANSSDGTNHLHNDTTTHYDDYGDDDDDDDDDDDTAHSGERRRRSSSFSNRGRVHHVYNNNKGKFQCYKCLLYAESATMPIRVNAFGPTSIRDLLQTIFTEGGLKHSNHNTGSETDFLRDYSIEIEDQDFGGIQIAFPRSIANFPTRCKLFINRKEPTETETTELIDKGVNEVRMDDKVLEKEPDKENDKEKQADKAMEDDDTNKDNGLLM